MAPTPTAAVGAVRTVAPSYPQRLRDAANLLEALLALDGQQSIEVAADIPARLSTADGRYLRVTSDLVQGSDVEIPDAEWFLTQDQETGLVWTHVLGDAENGQPHSEAIALFNAFTLRKVRFELSDIRQTLSIIDYELCDPAVDQRYFRGPYGYHWTRTPAKDLKEYAWAVDFGDGDSARHRQSARSHARGVAPSQSLGLR
jgi:hypothetical protein